MTEGYFDEPVNFNDTTRMRSSEVCPENFLILSHIDTEQEPERARDAGVLSPNLAFDADLLNPSSGTQRSAFFPWDNAAGTSSSIGAGFASVTGKDSGHISLDQADIRLHRPQSRSESRRGSIFSGPVRSGGAPDSSLSPVSGNRFSLSGIEDFQFQGDSQW